MALGTAEAVGGLPTSVGILAVQIWVGIDKKKEPAYHMKGVIRRRKVSYLNFFFSITWLDKIPLKNAGIISKDPSHL